MPVRIIVSKSERLPPVEAELLEPATPPRVHLLALLDGCNVLGVHTITVEESSARPPQGTR